jgi:hypothetical protein
VGVMNQITINTNAAMAVAGSVKLPVSSRAVSMETRPELAVTSELSQWLQQTAQMRGQENGVGGLLKLLSTVQALFPQAMPELLNPLQNRLQPYLLGTRQLSDASRIRQLVLHSGLFLESNLATTEGLQTLTDDLKLQLFQILTLMDPGRQLSLQAGFPVFANISSMTARGLQGTSESSSKPVRTGKQLQAYLQCSHDDPQGGVSDGMLNQWLQQQVEEVLRQLVQQQLQCHQDGEDTVWTLQLLLQQHDGSVQGLPLEIREHGQDTADWGLQFSLDLPRLGKVKIAMRIEGKTVQLVYQNDKVLTVQERQLHAQRLQSAFAAKNLALTSLSHRLMEKDDD